MKFFKAIFLIILLQTIFASAPVAVATDVSGNKAKTYVVIVSGINKDPEEKQSKGMTTLILKYFFDDETNVEPENIFVLVPKNSFARRDYTIDCTKKTLESILNKLAKTIQPQDTFIFYYTGQANIVKKKLRLNIPGTDIRHDQLAKLLKKIKAEQSLIVLDCPGSGLAVKSLMNPGRVIIATAGSDQHFSTSFSGYFVPAMTDSLADYDEDMRISLLEAFRYASIQMDEYYKENELMKTEAPLLEDDNDGTPSQRPWTFKTSGKDGLIASQWFLSEF